MQVASRFSVVLAALLLAVLPALAQKYPPVVQQSLDLVRKHIDQLPNGKGAGEVTPQTAAAVKQVFPDHRMVIVRFRIYPVARIMPEGLNASNVFAVTKDGKIEHLKDVKTMQKFFKDHHPAAKTEKDAKAVLGAWMTLTQEFHQDGMFKFEIQDKQFAVAQDVGLNSRGRLIVMAGGNGDLIAELDYDKDGKLAKVNEKSTIRPGPRPICQATKLLDADPIVRRIAEQDLLIMGLSARDYLMEQRDRATPELRDAIDRLWRQMQKNGW
jgi:hypothetical protein